MDRRNWLSVRGMVCRWQELNTRGNKCYFGANAIEWYGMFGTRGTVTFNYEEIKRDIDCEIDQAD
ncbi:hypothetical protein FRX31_004758 [Thalictrum thalictroides]|uniref:Uncharacterized protein n=1 Tax=Thalictrum thalictroides TaxID=46969 RepID=A0A7J6X7H3_THATH|nr:hypothetical protein FRX31_004758 [Thalictrum thalictroides]